MVIKIRRAGALEADVLTSIAKASSQNRCGLEHRCGESKGPLNISPEFIFWNDVFLAEIGAEVAGFYALSVENNIAGLVHLCVKPKFSGLGIGQKLITHAVEHSGRSNVEPIVSKIDLMAEGILHAAG